MDWLKKNKAWLARVGLSLLGVVLAAWGVAEGQREALLAAVGALLAGWFGLRMPADPLHLKTIMRGEEPVEIEAQARAVSRRMKRKRTIAPLPLFLAALFLAGCCSHSAVFQAYVEADKATYNVVAPPHGAYVQDDDSLTDEQKDLRILKLETWAKRITEAERLLKGGDE